MKHSIWLSFVLLVVLLTLGCKKDDPLDPSGTTTLPETSITFVCKDSVGISGILVGIAPLQSDRDAGVFMRSGETDGLGKIKFSSLDPQKFYYSCVRNLLSGTVTREGEVTVNKDERVTVNVHF